MLKNLCNEDTTIPIFQSELATAERPALPAPTPPGISPWLTLLIATACGLVVANLYYAQPLVGPISAHLGMSTQAAGLIVTMTQIGYCAGLLLVVPLGDLFENRRLIITVLGFAVFSLAAAALAPAAAWFLAAAIFIGLGSVAVQVLVPFAAHLAPEADRGRVVGNVMSGLMLGIMLSRPAASFIAETLSWHAVFAISAVVTALVAIVLRFALPRRVPEPGLSYGAMLASMAQLARHTPVLQRRALYHACLFGAFSLFWTVVPLLLAEVYHLSQYGIGLFALVGVSGAIAAPIAGRVADRGWSRPATAFAMLAAAAALLLAQLGTTASTPHLILLGFAAILLDFGVTAHIVLGQRAIFALGAALRSRLNGLYMATFFLGGAICSALGGWTYAQGGWSLSMAVALALPIMAFLGFLSEPRKPAQ